MHQPRLRGMRMRVDETWSDGLSAKVSFADAGTRKIQHIGVAAHGKKSVACNGDGLCARLLVIHRQDISVVKNQLRLFLFHWEQRKRSQRADEFAARGSSGLALQGVPKKER